MGCRLAVLHLPRQYLGYTAVGYPELSGDVTRSDAAVRELDDPLPHDVRQWPPVHEDATQLVYSPVA